MALTPQQYIERFYHRYKVPVADGSTVSVALSFSKDSGKIRTGSLLYVNAGKDYTSGKRSLAAIDTFRPQVLADVAAVLKGDTDERKVWVHDLVRDAISDPTRKKAESARKKLDTMASWLLGAVGSGKGSPAQITAALALLHHYQPKAKVADVSKAGAVVPVYKGTNPAAALEHFLLHFIGLDCCGFVGNYARHIGRRRTGQSHQTSWARDPKKLRTKLEDVSEGDVLVSGAHIAIIDSVSDPVVDTIEAVVVESCADGSYDGLTVTTSELEHVDGTTFTFTRAGQKPGKPPEFKIAPADDGPAESGKELSEIGGLL